MHTRRANMYCTEGTANTSVLLWETLHKDKPENFAFEFKCETFTFTTSQDALYIQLSD